MMPFHFQIVSVCHHSWDALQGIRDGRFAPPSFEQDKDYKGLQALVTEAQEGVASFWLPNLYFHATTTYDILRMPGVPLGKMDFLGRMKIG
jgi:hypothetical protein